MGKNHERVNVYCSGFPAWPGQDRAGFVAFAPHAMPDQADRQLSGNRYSVILPRLRVPGHARSHHLEHPVVPRLRRGRRPGARRPSLRGDGRCRGAVLSGGRAKLSRTRRKQRRGPVRPARKSAAGLRARRRHRGGRARAGRLQAPIAPGVPPYRDSWSIAHPGRPHPPTLGVYDKDQWPGEAFCCDFIFVTEDLAFRVEDVVVNAATDASDHQPVLLRLGW